MLSRGEVRHSRIGGGERSEPITRMLIMPYDTGRRLAVRTAMEHPTGALPCTPFASSRRSPQGETRSMERKNRESYISCTIPQFPPLVVNAVIQSPECLSCHMTQKANPVTLSFPLEGKSRVAGKGVRGKRRE